jgi:hypothetical protein
MAFYGDRFRIAGQQGVEPGVLTGGRAAIAEELALEWLHNAADSTRPRDAGNARMELAALADDGQAQGPLAVVGRAVAALDRVPWLTRTGLAALGLAVRALTQVTEYLSNPAVRDYALGKVRQHLGPDTRVLIGHSLGSVIAYEAAREHPHPLRLMVTLGSPLALSAVRTRLRLPPAFPPTLGRWVNLADRDDVVAARPHLSRVFDVNRPVGAVFDSTYMVDNGAQPHQAGFYLSNRQTGLAVATELG